MNLNRDYVNQPIGLQLHVLRNSCPDSKYPSYVTELLFIKSLQGKEFYKFVEVPPLKAVQESMNHLLAQSNRSNVHGPIVYDPIGYGP